MEAFEQQEKSEIEQQFRNEKRTNKIPSWLSDACAIRKDSEFK